MDVLYTKGFDLKSSCRISCVFNFFVGFFQVQGLVLEELCLHGCKELTDYSVEALVKHQQSLHRLDISACTELTNRSVEAIARSLKKLTHLSLSRDWRITEKGAHILLYYQYPRLTYHHTIRKWNFEIILCKDYNHLDHWRIIQSVSWKRFIFWWPWLQKVQKRFTTISSLV